VVSAIKYKHNFSAPFPRSPDLFGSLYFAKVISNEAQKRAAAVAVAAGASILEVQISAGSYHKRICGAFAPSLGTTAARELE
jgi:hypothetical protein